MKPLFFLLLIFFLTPVSLKSQLSDDFSDGNLSENPRWWGQADRFTVDAEELRLQSPPSENTAYIFVSAPTTLFQATVWSFKVRLEFSPSGSNFATVYLAASSPVLTADQEGYFLKIGGISGSDDALELYRQDGDDETLLLSGTPGAAAQDPVIASVQVRRSATGEWELLADYTGGENYQSEGTAQDATYPEGLYAGILCTYTSTRSDAFFFDDFMVEPVVPDRQPPAILGVDVLSATDLRLTLDEGVQPGPALENANYAISGGVGSPMDVRFEEDSFTQLRLTLGRPLADQTSYTLTASNLTDYAGNVASDQIDFDYFDIVPPAPGDLIINEILFNPQTGGSDFLELYNLSGKVLDLDGLRLLNTQVESSNREKEIRGRTLLLPGEYLVITPDPDDIIDRYDVRFPERLLDNTLPTLPNEEGNITLLLENTPLDSFNYTEDLHYDLLARTDGVSLERISFTAPSNDPGNWHSAAATAGFATPGYENSQFTARPSMLENMIEITNPRLSPDGDGFEDVLLIHYETPQPGYLLNLRIFDAQGRLVRNLVRNESLAAAGAYQWDGFTNERTKARIGIYVLWFELFDNSGKVEERKETVVVAGRL